MEIGMIGLGRMGANMATRLIGGGHTCVVFDLNPTHVESLVQKGAKPASSLKELVQSLKPSRAIWVMLPAGEITEKTISELSSLVSPGDILIDGGNSFFKDDVRRATELLKKNITYMDVGTSGGIWGAKRGYCLMVGGDTAAFERLTPIFRTLAPGRGHIEKTQKLKGTPTAEEGFLHCGPAGSGHFVKMIHNGIEYGLMQSYAEGFDILRKASSKDLPPGQRFDLDVSAIAEVWRRGSVVSSWLLDLISSALAEDPELQHFTGQVPDSGEGRWTIETAIEEAVPVDVLASALFARFRSRTGSTFGDKLLSAMRAQFGGHAETKTNPK